MVIEEGFGEAVAEVGKGSMSVDDDYARVTAYVAERLVVGAGDYMPSVTAHEAEFLRRLRWRRVVVPRIGVAGARGGIYGISISRRRGGRGWYRRSSSERRWWWGLH